MLLNKKSIVFSFSLLYNYFFKCYLNFRVKVTEDGKKALIDLAQGDMRKVLNILQSAATAFPEVSEDSVYTCVGHPLKSDIMNILKWLLNDDFSTTFKSKSILLVKEFNRYIK